MEQMVSVPYHRALNIADGVRLQFLDAGHVLGSALVVLDIEDDGAVRRLCFTGDLGRVGMPILRDPEVPSRVQSLIIESTYGDRMHPPIGATHHQLAEIIRKTHARGGKVIIPSFALERAQELIYALKQLSKQGQIPRLPIYVDSPLTVNVTDVFRLHPECYDEEARALIDTNSPFDFPELRYVSDRDESKAIDASPDPCVIISASGMCESGRVLHHLRSAIGAPENTVCIVGFQAQHTLGRRLVEQRSRVRIFGVERDRNCEIAVLNGFSAHADQRGLLEFTAAVADHGALSKIVLVHGEPSAQDALREELRARGFSDVSVPREGERLSL
jgi:metallo-beta-lactamase family protein